MSLLNYGIKLSLGKHFGPRDVEITQIPLPVIHALDKIAWLPDVMESLL